MIHLFLFVGKIKVLVSDKEIDLCPQRAISLIIQAPDLQGQLNEWTSSNHTWEEGKGIGESGWAEAEAHTSEISQLAGLVD